MSHDAKSLTGWACLNTESKHFWVPRRPMRVLRETEVSLTYDGGNLLAGMSRMALCAYDACEAGDEQDAQAIFERLRRMQF